MNGCDMRENSQGPPEAPGARDEREKGAGAARGPEAESPGRVLRLTSLAHGERVDAFVCASIPSLTRTAAKKAVTEGLVLVNGERVKPSHRLRRGDILGVTLPEKEASDLRAEPIPLEILFEDDDIIVINKPPGLAVHPGAGRRSGTLVNALLHHTHELSTFGGPERPGIVHRLDMDTSGVMVVAKNNRSHAALAEQFSEHTTERIYVALVRGPMKGDEGVIEKPLGRSPSDRKKISTRARKKRKALTRYRVLRRYGAISLLELMPRTGRTHQIRVHLASIGRPVVGDELYGWKGGRDAPPNLPQQARALLRGATRQCLHARYLGFRHPSTGEFMEFSAPPPPDMSEIIEALEKAIEEKEDAALVP